MPEFIEIDSLAVARALYEIVKGESKIHDLAWWGEEIRPVLRSLLDVEDEKTLGMTRQSIDKLYERGLTGYRDLLK